MDAATTGPEVGREYTREILDRSTGELQTISLGRWLTVSELGAQYGVGPRQVRTVLRDLDFLYLPGGSAKRRHRISPWAVEAGLGLHHDCRKGVSHPFDAISPAGKAWIAKRWSYAWAAVQGRQMFDAVARARAALDDFKTSRDRRDMSTQMEVCWLADHFPELSQTQMAVAIDVTQQLVSRHMKMRAAQRQRGRAWRSSQLGEPEGPCWRDPSPCEVPTVWLDEINNASSQHLGK